MLVGLISVCIAIIITGVYVIMSHPPHVDERITSPHYEVVRDRANVIIAQSISRVDPCIRDICEYAVDDGRRVRSVIVLEVAGGADAAAAVSAVEFIHAASLIVDDIMDGDTVRRGKPTVSARYGQAAAQMASVQLVALAFIEIQDSVVRARDSNPNADRRGIDSLGVVAETIRDLSIGQHREQQHDMSDKIMREKTGSLFEMAFICGWLARDGAEDRVSHVRDTARQFGELFQIVDDIGDMYRDSQQGILTNYAIAHGVDRARERCLELAVSIIKRCNEVDISTLVISEIVDYLVEKSKK